MESNNSNNNNNNSIICDYFLEIQRKIKVQVDDKYDIDRYVMISFDDIIKIVESCDEATETQKTYIHNIVKSLYNYGFETPSYVQSLVVLPIINNKDCLIQAQSGSGKTASFLLGGLVIVDPTIKCPQILIITHNRELATQIFNVGHQIFGNCGISFALHIGGIKSSDYPKYPNNHNNNFNEQVIIGTPGRILDLLNKKFIDKSELRLLILDEVDELLGEGHIDNIKNIISTHISKDIQICVFSATITTSVIGVTNNFLTDPIKVLIQKEHVSLDGIAQYCIDFTPLEDEIEKTTKRDRDFNRTVEHELEIEKILALRDIIKELKSEVIIVFVNSKITLTNIMTELNKTDNGVKALHIHGDMAQTERLKIFDDFRKNTSVYRVLLSTNLLARGIDIHQISLVINFDIPEDSADYIHRIGRTGRYGKSGKTINFITKKNNDKMKEIAQKFNIKLKDYSEFK